MKRWLQNIFVALVLIAPPPAKARVPKAVPATGFEKSVVSLIASKRAVDMDSPWRFKESYSEKHLGVAVGDGRILTTAFAIHDATLIEMQRLGQSRKDSMRVFFVDYETNLALLVPDDPKTVEDMVPLKLGEAIATNDEVWIFSDRESNQLIRNPARLIETGVYRATTSSYSTAAYLLKVQQTGLGWSEPIIRGRELVGLSTGQDDNHIFAIPSPMIAHFLNDSLGPEYRGFPDLGVTVRSLVAPNMRKLLKAEKFDGGQYVVEVDEDSAFRGVLQPNDVIIAVADRPINDTGLYVHPDWGKIHFRHLISELYSGDELKLSIVREGTEMSVSAKLRRHDSNHQLVVFDRYNQPELHLIFGGLVFQELSRDFLREWGKEWRLNAPLDLLYVWEYQNKPSAKGERVVILNRVLADAFNQGYEQLQNLVVESVNGRKISSIGALREALETPVAKNGKRFAVIRFQRDGGEIILDFDAVAQAQKRIAQTYSVNDRQSFFWAH